MNYAVDTSYLTNETVILLAEPEDSTLSYNTFSTLHKIPSYFSPLSIFITYLPKVHQSVMPSSHSLPLWWSFSRYCMTAILYAFLVSIFPVHPTLPDFTILN